MMDGWIRFVAIVGGGVFAFSVLVGLLAGVPFANVFVRALASSTVIGGLAAAAAHVVPRLLPGLTGPDGGNDPQQPGGGSVNIVVDDTSDDKDDAASAGSLVEEVVEQSASDAGQVMSAVIEEERGDGSPALEDQDLDQMPDIASMAGSFVAAAGGGDEAKGQSDDGFGDFVPVSGNTGRSLTNDQGSEAETIAKAMRTMMARDT